MQIKEQWKGSKNWKMITGVATAATLGFGAIAVAAPGSNDVPDTINLNDRAVVTESSFVPNSGGFVPFIDFSADDSAQASASLAIDDTASVDESISSQQAIDDSISPQDSLDVSPQASIDDSISAQDDSISVESDDSFDSADDSD